MLRVSFLRISFFSFFFILSIGHSSLMACNLSNVSLINYTQNGADYDYVIEVCMGGGVLGTNFGADDDTQNIAIGLYSFGNTVAVSNFTPSITSTNTGSTMNATITGPLGTPFNSENAIGYLQNPAEDPFQCISSTAICGEPLSDCFTISFTTDVYLDSLRVFGVEGNGNPVGGCYPNADMALDFITLLPVELRYFRGQQANDKIVLEWETASEIDNDHFIVERAGASGHFAPIALVEGAGTSSISQQYTYSDLPQKGGTYYYRLKQVDFDGTETYKSPVEVIYYEEESKTTLSLFPNPATHELFLSADSFAGSPEIMVHIYDYAGQLLYQQSRSLNGTLGIPVGDLPVGLYIMEARRADGTILDRKRFIKK